MDYQEALALKTEMVAGMLGKKNAQSPFISFAPTTRNVSLGVGKALAMQVNGIGIANKPNGDGVYIKVFTRDSMRYSNNALHSYYSLSAGDMMVEKVGRITFKTLRDKHRPPFPGLSAGHYKIRGGTLGCLVTDDAGIQYILSNNHVLANSNNSLYADPILQPALMDGGTKNLDEIAQLSSFIELDFNGPNKMDAAIARINDNLTFDTAIAGIKQIVGTALPVNNMKVEKYGRTTGYTAGVVTTRHLDLQVEYGGRIIDFEDQFEVKGAVVNGKRAKFCSGGDSGAIIMETKTGLAIGMLFAGTDDGTSFATPINEILDAFSVKML